MTQISPNFYLHEFTQSQNASRMGKEIKATPKQVANIERLCVEILEPLREHFDRPISISSGLRPDWLNKLVGGSKSSQHMTGQACDFTVHGHTPKEVCEAAIRLSLPFDQNILEFGRWTHISVPTIGHAPRRQSLTAISRNGKTMYKPGIL